MILVIDNYDSFTYNLVQYLGELAEDYPIAQDIQVYRNDKITIEEVLTLNPDAIIISPGPGIPDYSGICLELVKQLGENYPILGVCLGHQNHWGRHMVVKLLVLLPSCMVKLHLFFMKIRESLMLYLILLLLPVTIV